MTATTEKILKEALDLPSVDRTELIERLFQSFDPSPDSRVDSAWANEIESRIDAYNKGKLEASDAEDVLARINKR